jgi:hypothetical protein
VRVPLAGFFRRNVGEIRWDPVLRVYGSILAFVHVLTFVHWHRGLLLRHVLAESAVPICWPFFEECYGFRVLSPTGVDALLWGYLTLAVAALLLFTRRWTTGAAYVALIALELVLWASRAYPAAASGRDSGRGSETGSLRSAEMSAAM